MSLQELALLTVTINRTSVEHLFRHLLLMLNSGIKFARFSWICDRLTHELKLPSNKELNMLLKLTHNSLLEGLYTGTLQIKRLFSPHFPDTHSSVKDAFINQHVLGLVGSFPFCQLVNVVSDPSDH